MKLRGTANEGHRRVKQIACNWLGPQMPAQGLIALEILGELVKSLDSMTNAIRVG